MSRALAIAVLLAAPAARADATPPVPGAKPDPAIQVHHGAAPETLLERIAFHLQNLKTHDSRLGAFNQKKALHSEGDRISLDFEHATRDVPNPNYDRQVREAEEEERRHGPMLRGAIPKTLHTIDPDGVAVHLLLERERVARMEQRVFPTYAHLGEWLLEVNVAGGKKAPDPGLGAIQRAIDEEIERTEAPRGPK